MKGDLWSLAILPGLVAAAIAYLITPLVIRFAWKFGLVDDPNVNKHPKVIHNKPTPRGGGLGLFIAIAISALLFLPIDKHLIGILAGATILVVLGIIDDKRNLSPYIRMPLMLLAASLPIAAGIGIAYINNPLGGGIIDLSYPQIGITILGQSREIWLLADIFALIWIFTLMNMLNMGAKGVPGQLTGTVIVAAITVCLLSLKFSADITQWPVIVLSAILAGAFLGFAPWHIPPQKIMPSFSGSTIAGYLLAVLAILSTAKVGILLVALGIPIIDTTYTMIRRILHGKSPVWGDRGHLHHKLLDAGWPIKSVMLFYWITTAILGFVALNLSSQNKLYTIIGVSIFVAGLLIMLTRKEQKQ